MFLFSPSPMFGSIEFWGRPGRGWVVPDGLVRHVWRMLWSAMYGGCSGPPKHAHRERSQLNVIANEVIAPHRLRPVGLSKKEASSFYSGELWAFASTFILYGRGGMTPDPATGPPCPPSPAKTPLKLASFHRFTCGNCQGVIVLGLGDGAGRYLQAYECSDDQCLFHVRSLAMATIFVVTLSSPRDSISAN